MRINPRFFFTLKPLSIIIKTGSDNMFDEIKEKIEKVSKEIYGATNVEYLYDVKEKIMNAK